MHEQFLLHKNLVLPNWSWNLKEHITTSVLMKHGKFVKASNDLSTKEPNKNIVHKHNIEILKKMSYQFIKDQLEL